MYYPATVSPEMGPTRVIRGSWMLPDPSGDHLFLHPDADPPWPDSAHRSTDVPVARQLNAEGKFVPAVPPTDYGEELPLAVRAGTVAVIRKECWHRGSRNTSASHRYMFKQGVLRVCPPTASPPTSTASA